MYGAARRVGITAKIVEVSETRHRSQVGSTSSRYEIALRKLGYPFLVECNTTLQLFVRLRALSLPLWIRPCYSTL